MWRWKFLRKVQFWGSSSSDLDETLRKLIIAKHIIEQKWVTESVRKSRKNEKNWILIINDYLFVFIIQFKYINALKSKTRKASFSSKPRFHQPTPIKWVFLSE